MGRDHSVLGVRVIRIVLSGRLRGVGVRDQNVRVRIARRRSAQSVQLPDAGGQRDIVVQAHSQNQERKSNNLFKHKLEISKCEKNRAKISGFRRTLTAVNSKIKLNWWN
jgi:hypothetical protein